MPERRYHVYVLASSGRVLYVGCTGNLAARMHQHRTRAIAGFTKRYNVHRLVHLEEYARARDAVRRERQLKGWRRDRKIALIEADNPGWHDLWAEVVG